MKNLTRILVLTATALTMSLAPAFAAELNIFGNAFKEPKIWKVEGESRGILVDIMKYAAREMGQEVKFELHPWARSYFLAERGDGGIIGISKTAERLKLFDYSDPVYSDQVILVVKKGKEFAFNKFEDLKGKKIGVCRNCSFGADYEKAKTFFTLAPDNGNISRLKKILKGRVDAGIVSPGIAALKMIVKNDPDLEMDMFTVLPKPLVEDPNYLAFSKSMKMGAFLKTFNKVVKKGYQDNTIQKIIDKY